MIVNVFPTRQEIGARAASDVATRVRNAISEGGNANIIVGTGASQFGMLKQLAREAGIDWRRVTIFHLDEYIGLPISHPASFRRYPRERFVDQLPAAPGAFHELSGECESAAQCRRVGEILRANPIAVVFVGISENGHLAFNDPPADFGTDAPFLLVELDQKCRLQQWGRGVVPASRRSAKPRHLDERLPNPQERCDQL